MIGGFFTTYLSWRYVFAGEVLIVIAIQILARRATDEPVTNPPKIDLVGAALSAAGFALVVLGVLKSSTWGWFLPKPEAPSLAGLSLHVLVRPLRALRALAHAHVAAPHGAPGKEPLVAPALLKVPQLTGGLITFLFLFLVQAGVFFIVPLFLSVVLGMSPMETGIRLLPLSLSLLVAAVGIPRFRPQANPRRVVRIGLLALVAGIVALIAGLEVGADSSIVFVPLLIIGLGIGALASQLGAVTVSAVPEEKSSEVGGLQNTATQLGASLGTALAGSVLVAALATSFLAGIDQNPDVPQSVKDQANVQLAGGAPFISTAQLEESLDAADVPDDVATEIVDQNNASQIDGLRAALAILAVIGGDRHVLRWADPQGAGRFGAGPGVVERPFRRATSEEVAERVGEPVAEARRGVLGHLAAAADRDVLSKIRRSKGRPSHGRRRSPPPRRHGRGPRRPG